MGKRPEMKEPTGLSPIPGNSRAGDGDRVRDALSLFSRSAPSPTEPTGRRLAAWAWCALITAAFLAGTGLHAMGVPAPYILAALVVGMVLALSGLVTAALPRPAYRTSQALAGVLMGGYIHPAALKAAAPSLVPLTVVTIATVLLSIGVARLLCRSCRLDRPTAALAMVPGGAAAMLAASDDLGADTRLVALAQYSRIGVIAMSAPLVVPLLDDPVPLGRHGASEPSSPFSPGMLHLVDGPAQPAGLLVLCALAVLGVQAGKRLSLPAPVVLGPMLLTVVATFSGAAHGFAPTGLLQSLVFTCVGLEIGLRFTRESIRHARRVIPYLVAGTVAVSAASALLACALAGCTGLSFASAYLATTPGGINAVLATSVATKADVGLVSSVQSLRLFAVVGFAPLLIRLTTVRRGRTTRRTTTARLFEERADLPVINR